MAFRKKQFRFIFRYTFVSFHQIVGISLIPVNRHYHGLIFISLMNYCKLDSLGQSLQLFLCFIMVSLFLETTKVMSFSVSIPNIDEAIGKKFGSLMKQACFCYWTPFMNGHICCSKTKNEGCNSPHISCQKFCSPFLVWIFVFCKDLIDSNHDHKR